MFSEVRSAAKKCESGRLHRMYGGTVVNPVAVKNSSMTRQLASVKRPEFADGGSVIAPVRLDRPGGGAKTSGKKSGKGHTVNVIVAPQSPPPAAPMMPPPSLPMAGPPPVMPPPGPPAMPPRPPMPPAMPPRPMPNMMGGPPVGAMPGLRNRGGRV